MKQLFLLITVVLCSSCQWYNENLSSTEKCIEWYIEKIYKNVEDDNVYEVIRLLDDLDNYYDEMIDAEEDIADRVFENWSKRNTYKFEKIQDFLDENDIPR